MSAPTSLALLRSTVQKLFPWLARFGISETTKALEIRSAGSRIEIEGGGPAVARVDDVAGFEYLQVVAAAGVVSAVVLWRSRANGSASSWSAVASGVIPPVNGVTSGTAITITTGSEKVSCG